MNASHESNVKQVDESRVNGLQCTMNHNGTMKNKGPKDQRPMQLLTMNQWPWIYELKSTIGLEAMD